MILLTSRVANGGHTAPHCDQDCRQGLKIADSFRSAERYPGSGPENALHQLARIEERESISHFSDLFEFVPREVGGGWITRQVGRIQ